MTRPALTLVTLALGCLLTANAWSGEKEQEEQAAGPDHTGVVKYRHVMMKSVGAHNYASALIVKGKVEGRDGDLVAHAEALHAASLAFGDLFPAGSGPDVYERTDALATIWEKTEEFAAANKRFQEVTAAFVEAARGDDADARLTAFKAVGESCGNCHDTFRKDEDH